MKRLLVLLALMGAGVYLMLKESDKKEIKKAGKKLKKKLRKSHFPKKEVLAE
ncbi:MAG: hypothetical protein ABI136_06540 [Ginsengibacter sp.]